MNQAAKIQDAKGPLVWLDMDQKALDDAYDQMVYAPNRDQVHKRNMFNSDRVRARLGAPKRLAYGSKPLEQLDLFATDKANAPINVFIHGGAWRGGLAKNYAFPAETFVNAGAHFVVPDFDAVTDVDGNLMVMADQVRRTAIESFKNPSYIGGQIVHSDAVKRAAALSSTAHVDTDGLQPAGNEHAQPRIATHLDVAGHALSGRAAQCDRPAAGAWQRDAHAARDRPRLQRRRPPAVRGSRERPSLPPAARRLT